jgi:hypothetical protein
LHDCPFIHSYFNLNPPTLILLPMRGEFRVYELPRPTPPFYQQGMVSS